MERATKGLAIYIPSKTYRPGDTITGHAYRQVPVLVGENNVTVTISLIGCSHTTVTEWSDHTGESQWTFSSITRFLDPKDTSLTLHTGPLHVPRKVAGLAPDPVQSQDPMTIDGISWPFEITVPLRTASKQVHMSECRGGDVLDEVPRKVKECVSRGEVGEVKAGSELPGSYFGGKNEFSPFSFVEGSVHYFLEARLVSEGANNRPLASAPITIVNGEAAR
ncbi:hypothetical protein VFPPC_06347 [Pochonia chlamydosporia 170]|uniref:Arrestin-like N-terminal domain-containing protein n=1 Tax=Pochonia chlamydosporia 170 TaxID=1380566 RepID=A0A179FIX2_METCM|nr:hypothetical protein VFPPC_06347 [Pochonia chlamydosporia 170]OAQ65200.1 hypothetical protein VFPPC_06347 [Pochonia chlamydosporia 170]